MQKKKHPQTEPAHAAEKHPKQDFQVERIAFFSDAVFAIAITLLIIDFHPPHITKASTYEDIWQGLVEMKYKLLALLVSFLMITSYWRQHHFLFKHIHDYNRRIITANMLILLPIIFFPFTTSFLYESLNGSEGAIIIPFRLFFINNLLTSLLIYYFYWLISKKYRPLSYPIDPEEKTRFKTGMLLGIGTFILILILSLISVSISYWGVVPMVLTRFFLRRIKKNKTIFNQHAKQTGGSGH